MNLVNQLSIRKQSEDRILEADDEESPTKKRYPSFINLDLILSEETTSIANQIRKKVIFV